MSRVLLADDSITMQKVVELVLSGEGFDVISVANGEEALAAIRESHPDIVIADIEMPVLNGYQLSEKIKADPATRSIPVILLASAFDTLDEELTAASGADDTLVKPFESEDLLEKISALLYGRARQAESAEEAAEEVLEAEEVPGGQGEEELWAVEGLDLAEEVEAEPIEEITEEAIEVAIPEREAPAPEQRAQEAQPEERAAPAAEERPPAGAGGEDLSEVLREAALKRLDEMLGAVDLRALLLQALEPSIKDAVEKVLWEITPELVERLLRETLRETMGTLRKELENVIWETVPDLAESIIRKEIEAIRAQSS
jgi:CheY-like chemotaxis protein